MKAKKIITRSLLILLMIAIGYGFYYCWISFPILSGYAAKVACSAVFVAGRDPQQIRQQELGTDMMKLAHFTVDYTDSSVTATVFGFAKQKAIYRAGLGATLVSELSEKDIRAQHIDLPSKPPVDQDTVNWPMGDRLTDSFPSNINKIKLQDAIQYAFDEKDTTRPVRTRAVVVLYNGQLIAEKYANGFSKSMKLLGWSMTKSITGALIGILVKQGKLNIDSPAPVPEWKNINDPRHDITIKNLLQQSSGLNFEENYSKSADATKMLFEKADMGGFTASHNLKDKPGTVFYYSSGNSNILSRIIRQAVGDSLYYRFPSKQLFYKLGMYSAVIEPDASGTFVGSSYMYATARDWARFGLLYMNDGIYNGERILPEGWVHQSVQPASSSKKGEYGYQIWLNAGKDGFARHFPGAPADMFYADGFETQHIFIIPSKKLVIVRLGLTEYNNFNGDEFLKKVIDAVN